MPGLPPDVAVLDDEAEMRIALSRLLLARGLRVATFANSEELFAALDSRDFNCVLLDLHMPGMSGFEVLGKLAVRRSRLPVIVITGHDAPGNHDRACALGAVEYLLKPVDQADLLAAIERATRPPAQPC